MERYASGSENYSPKPEFDPSRPAAVYEYGQKKQRWIKSSLSPRQQLAELDELVGELNSIALRDRGDDQDIIVTSRDVIQTVFVERKPLLTDENETNRRTQIVITTQQLPVDDRGEEFTGLERHRITGRLFSFHLGDNNEVRANISEDKPGIDHPGVAATLLTSVAIENSDFEIADFSGNRLEQLVTTQLLEQPPHIQSHGENFIKILRDTSLNASSKIFELNRVLSQIVNFETKTGALVDNLLALIALTQRFDLPHTVHASRYQQSVGRSGYVPINEEKVFEKVIITPGLLGETNRKNLGLFFYYSVNGGDGEIPIEVPSYNVNLLYLAEE